MFGGRVFRVSSASHAQRAQALLRPSATCISSTCSCYRRLPLLRSRQSQANILVTILGEVRDRYGFALVGYVAMPEHIHLLVGEPTRGTPSTVMQVFKQRVSPPPAPQGANLRAATKAPLRPRSSATLLAVTLPRLQRSEPQEKSREATLRSSVASSLTPKIGRGAASRSTPDADQVSCPSTRFSDRFVQWAK